MTPRGNIIVHANCWLDIVCSPRNYRCTGSAVLRVYRARPLVILRSLSDQCLAMSFRTEMISGGGGVICVH